MSDFKGHLLAGGLVAVAFVAFELLLLNNINFVVLGLGVALCLFMSIAPDVDSATSKARKIFLAMSFAAIIILTALQFYWMIIIVCVLCMIVVLDSKHRGMTHSTLFALIMCVPFVFIDVWLAVAGLLSVWSHLALDRLGKKDNFPY
jgi:membrane-bound metal-dependent hydrolase YbcI (DUF457 family)